MRKGDRPIAGTRLIREWQGVEHTATVLDDGFEYQGRRYKSLSAIARAVTGTRWNGPLFWGLRNHSERQVKAPVRKNPLRHLHPQVLDEEGLDMEFNSLDAQREAAKPTSRARSTKAGCWSATATTTAASPAAPWNARRCSGCCATSSAAHRRDRRLQGRSAVTLAH